MLGDAERRLFDTFGFLRVPGLLADVVADLQGDFDHVVRSDAVGYLACRQFMDGSPNGCGDRARLLAAEPLAASRALGWLRTDDVRLDDLATAILGPEAAYQTSMASLFNCNVHWHHDGVLTAGRGCQATAMIYLDPLDGPTGALRVIPGSHRPGPFREALRAELLGAEDPLAVAFGRDAPDLPSVVVATEPGDVVVIDSEVFHASFGGGVGRRLLSVTYGAGAPPSDPAAVEALLAAAARPLEAVGPVPGAGIEPARPRGAGGV